MKTKIHAFHLPSLALAAFTVLFSAGCYDDDDDGIAYDSNGEPYYYTYDYYDMGTIYPTGSYYYYKVSARDTLPGETVTQPLTLQSACSCFVRVSTFSGKSGFERVRTDSVTFLDAGGTALVSTATPKKLSKILHKRRVVSTAGSREADILYDLNASIVPDSADTTKRNSIWNGTISGEFNGQAISEGTVVNVVRPLVDSSFGFPESGTITVNHPKADLVITFQPDSSAQVSITDTENDKTYDLTVDKNFVETLPRLSD